MLIGVYGSAGDLFPLVAVGEQLRSRGAEVRFIVPRSLGGYLRILQVPAFAMGSGAELKVFSDGSAFSTRFDGWSSIRRTAVDYVRTYQRG